MKKTFLYFMKWNFPTPGLKALVFLGEPRGDFVTVSSHYFISLLIFIFFSCVFIVDCICVHFTVSGHCWLHLFTSFFVSYFVFVLVLLFYRECYGFERVLFTLRRFVPYFPSRHIAQHAFINASLGLASHLGLKHRLSPFACLNHTLFKRYKMVAYIYALGTITDYYINHLSLILNSLYY